MEPWGTPAKTSAQLDITPIQNNALSAVWEITLEPLEKRARNTHAG